MKRWVALDFETADAKRDSACAVGIVLVEGRRVVEQHHFLIRPPRVQFTNTRFHGITWQQVAGRPTFRQLWPSLRKLLQGAEFIAAHNRGFDRSVLRACCEAAEVAVPSNPFLCTVRLAKGIWGMPSATLPTVCDRLGIQLSHHQAHSDAAACARIVLAAGLQAARSYVDPRED